jgi:guanosine-3',5'-bis(diphosphate) 3'-pyrophosphohydrolase
MKDLVIDLEAEKNEILKRYRALLRASKSTLQKGDKRMIRKAFEMALESHKICAANRASLISTIP